MNKYSKSYSQIIDATFLAKGGEAIVYRVEHTGSDEIVIKCPLFDPEASLDNLTTLYDSIFYESALLKLLPYYKHMAEIKEEIIEYNKEK